MSNTNKKSWHKKSMHSEDSLKDENADTIVQDSGTSELFICAKCGKPIKDISAALANKTDGSPVHFDCVLQFLQASEPLQANETITYIGQGRFAVIKYASMVIMKEFTIVRIIEWEDKNQRAAWRGKIADRFSLID